jgi:hypothetical protein
MICDPAGLANDDDFGNKATQFLWEFGTRVNESVAALDIFNDQPYSKMTNTEKAIILSKRGDTGT